MKYKKTKIPKWAEREIKELEKLPLNEKIKSYIKSLKMEKLK